METNDLENLAKILQLIFICIDTLNEQQPPNEQVEKSASTVLAGSGSVLESLSLINLIVGIEDALEPIAHHRVDVLEKALMSKDGAKFSTVEELAKWIATQIK